MKPEYTPLSKLTEQTKAYKVKVKVIQKAPPRQSPGKRRYQRLLLKDDEGTVMKGALFQDDINMFEKALERNGEYEISGATIQVVPPQFQSKPNEMQMNFNERVTITPISVEKCASEPQYMKLCAIPFNHKEEDELLDTMGALLFVGETRTVTFENTEYKVREVVIKDESLSRPMTISAWNEFARGECESLANHVEAFQVIGFCGLRRLSKRGLSLGTTMSTAIVMEPTGERAEQLKAWVDNNKEFISQCRMKLLDLYNPQPMKPITTIAEIDNKKGDTTLQEEKYWLDVTMPTADSADLYCYLGCSNCGKRTQTDPNCSTCGFCTDTNAHSVPRATFTFYATDTTGSYKFTIFTKEVETLFGISLDALHELKTAENTAALEEKIKSVQKKRLLLQIGPTNALSTSNILKWAVHSLVIQENNN